MDSSLVKLGLPTGRIQQNVNTLLADAGIQVVAGARSYRPKLSLLGFDTKSLKTQNIVEMLEAGSRDIGFAGIDWVRELKADLVELLDTGFDPVRIVAAAPPGFPEEASYRNRQLLIASEYVSLSRDWAKSKNFDAKILRSYGTTEVFPPEDADCIVDNTATGATLQASGLTIVDELLCSSTRLFANPRALEIPEKRERIEALVLLLRAVLEARRRVMIEVNVSAERLESVAAALPSMRNPTVSELHNGAGYVVKAAIKRELLPTLVPQIKALGGTDIVVTSLSHVVP